MSAGKICASCGNMWAPAFRFCPVDGKPLTEEVHPIPVETVEDAQARSRKGSGRLIDIPPVQDEPPTTDRSENRPRPAPGAIAGPRTKRQSKQIAPHATTSFELPAAHAEARKDPTLVERAAVSPEPAKPAAKAGRAPAEAAPRQIEKEPASRVSPRAPTAVVPAGDKLSDTGPMATLPSGAAASHGKQVPAGKSDSADKKDRKRGFSETAWFMRVVDPNAVDRNTGKVKVEDDDYKPNKALPAEKRKLFSLGSKPAGNDEES